MAFFAEWLNRRGPDQGCAFGGLEKLTLIFNPLFLPPWGNFGTQNGL